MGIHCIYINKYRCTFKHRPGTGHSTGRKRSRGQSRRPCGGIADGNRTQGEMDAVGFGGQFLEDGTASQPPLLLHGCVSLRGRFLGSHREDLFAFIYRFGFGNL